MRWALEKMQHMPLNINILIIFTGAYHSVAEKALFVVSPSLHSVRHTVACLSISHIRECYSFLAVWEGVIHDLGCFYASLVLVVALLSLKADYIWVARSRSLDGDRWLDAGYPVISAKLDLVNLKRISSPLVCGDFHRIFTPSRCKLQTT